MITVDPAYKEYLGTLQPMRGTCLALFEQDSTQEGKIKGFFIPQTAKIRNRLLYNGIVIAEYPVMEPSHLATLAGVVGRRCCFNPTVGQLFLWKDRWVGKYKLTVEHIIAVFYENEWLDLKSYGKVQVDTFIGDGGGLKRCRFCKSAGKYNIFLDGDGICPICRCKEDGKKHIPYRHTIKRGDYEETIELTNEPRLTEEAINILGGQTCQHR